MSPWILAARPKTLPAAVAPVWFGTWLAWVLQGKFDLLLAISTLLSCLGIQVATNFFNDVIDHEKGTDTEARLGPTRITQAGLASPRKVWLAAFLALSWSCAWAIPLILAHGWPILAIGLPSILLAYAYTGGPFPLAYKGLGELFVILFFGLIAVGGSYFVQTGEVGKEALLGGVQIGLLSAVLIAINNFRDQAEDRAAGKKTLAVRWGSTFARLEIIAFSVLPYSLGAFWLKWGHQGAHLLSLMSLIVTIGIVRRMLKAQPGPENNTLLAASALQLLLFTALISIGLQWNPTSTFGPMP